MSILDTTKKKQKIYEGDIGTCIRVDCGTDVSNGTIFQIKGKISGRPEEITWNAERDPDDPNFIRYFTQEGDLVKGTYKIQSYVQTATWRGRGNVTSFKVYEHYT